MPTMDGYRKGWASRYLREAKAELTAAKKTPYMAAGFIIEALTKAQAAIYYSLGDPAFIVPIVHETLRTRQNVEEPILNFLVEIEKALQQLAQNPKLCLIIHSRGTTSQIVSLLPSYKIKKVLLHWFSQPHSLIPTIVDRGYYITEGPPSVFSDGIREVIRRIPLTNLMTETDGPVRFRGPFKGKLTTPSFIPTVVEAIAQLKGKEKTEVADQIFQNFIDFFGVEGVRDKRHDEGTIQD